MGLAAWSFTTGDSRFGWGMFSRNTEYGIQYRWILEDGSQVRFQPGKELRSGSRKIHTPRRHRSRRRNTRYGLTTLRTWIAGYIEWMYQNKRHEGAAAIEATVLYRVDEIPGPGGRPPDRFVVRYPEGTAP